MAIKRAKVIDEKEFKRLLKVVRLSAHPLRDEVALRLSYFAGLRAAEIAGLRWNSHLLGPTGKLMDDIHILSDIAKRSVERVIPMEPGLHAVLQRLRAARPEDEFVFYALHNYNRPRDENGGWTTEIGQVTPSAVVQWFKRLYAQVGYVGCTSHSGRRTFITTRARTANYSGCSLEDVRLLAGHKSLETTQGYIEPSEHQRKLVSAWG